MTKGKVIIGFEVTKEKKEAIEKAAREYQVQKISVPLKISQYVRMSVDRLLQEEK